LTTSIPDISAAIDRLRTGGVVAFPTETVYGLGADAFNQAAVRRVFQLKGRPAINPLIVHVSGPEMATRVVAEWTDDAAALARAFWPGPLTIVLPKADRVPAIVTAGGPTVGVRCPDHPVALALLFGLGSPLVGPSANLSGQISPTDAEHVRQSFRPEDVLVLEGGPCRTGIESTVVSLADRARVLRRGMIAAGEIAAVIGRPVAEPSDVGLATAAPSTGPLPSPGQLPRHYAPRSPARLFDSPDLPALLRDPALAQRGAVVIAYDGPPVTPPHRLIRMPRDPQDYAYQMYAALREADALKPAIILVQRPPRDPGLWEAISDRLRRATSPA